MPKIQADMEETHQPDERNRKSRGERENPRLYTQEWVYLGIIKDGKALNRGHALMHMLTWKYITITIAHTRHESIDRIRRNIAEKHKHRHNMEASNE